VDTTNTYIQSEGRLVATVGVDNLIIIDTEDAILVTVVA
jgi:mannose-1-phosphate guanylyltransferase